MIVTFYCYQRYFALCKYNGIIDKKEWELCFCLLFLFRSDNRSYQVKKISKPGLRYDATVRCQYDIRLVF